MREFFTECNNRLSMKRLCAFIGTIALCIAAVIKPMDSTIYSLAFIVSSSLGFTTFEKVFKK